MGPYEIWQPLLFFGSITAGIIYYIRVWPEYTIKKQIAFWLVGTAVIIGLMLVGAKIAL